MKKEHRQDKKYRIKERPRKERLSGMSVREIREEFGVAHTTATKWLAEIGEYEPDRATCGTTSELCARLSEMDPDEVPPTDDGREGSA